MENTKHYYIDLEGNKVEYILEKPLTISQKVSLVLEAAGTVMSKELGCAYKLLKWVIFEYYLITYCTNIVLFDDNTEFSLDKVEKFLDENKENVLDVIRENMSDDEEELRYAYADAIEYKMNHCNDLKDEIEDLLQVVREFVVKPDRMNELLDALTYAVTKFADREDIDFDALNKFADIIPVLQDMDNKDVAKAVIKDLHTKE